MKRTNTVVNFVPGIGPILAQWKLIAVVGLCAVLGWFVWDWEHRGRLLEQQIAINAVLQHNVESAQQELQISKDAIEAVTARLREAQINHTTITNIIQDATHAPDSSNAALAPVLRQSLDSLRKLRASGGSPKQ